MKHLLNNAGGARTLYYLIKVAGRRHQTDTIIAFTYIPLYRSLQKLLHHSENQIAYRHY